MKTHSQLLPRHQEQLQKGDDDSHIRRVGEEQRPFFRNPNTRDGARRWWNANRSLLIRVVWLLLLLLILRRRRVCRRNKDRRIWRFQRWIVVTTSGRF